jgi:predicted O-methyltransferase YrrM
MYHFTQNWFNNSEIKKKLSKFLNPNNINKILEIGSFEGQSSIFFADNYLNNKDSSLTCVDPFYESGTKDGITTLFVTNKTKDKFINNINQSINKDKINFINTTSDYFFKQNKETYTFIYLDGCHNPDYLERDLENSINIIEKNGIIWIDDYLYHERDEHRCRPMEVIHKFLVKYKNRVKIIHKGYQLAFRVIE